MNKWFTLSSPKPNVQRHVLSRRNIAAIMLILVLSLCVPSVSRASAAPTPTSPAINFHIITDAATYSQLRWQVISIEETAIYCPYLDPKDIPTIGIGFNLRDANIFTTVIDTLVPGPTSGSTALTAGQQKTLQNIIGQKYTKYPYSSCDSGNQLMTAINAKMATFHAKNMAIPNTLNFSSLQQMRNTFDVAVQMFESKVTNFANIPIQQYSVERVALVSLAYNTPALLGPKLKSAIQSGNRALAWYEIRYDSEAENDSNSSSANESVAAGLAKRRDFESDLFGLYDNNPFNPATTSLSNTNATQVMSMVAVHENQLYTSVAPDGSDLYNNRYYVNPDDLIGNAQTDYATAITAVQAILGNFTVRALAQDLGPAVNYLLNNTAATSLGNTLVLKNPNAVDLTRFGASPLADFVQPTATGTAVTLDAGSNLVYSSSNDTFTMGAGLEELTFGGGQQKVNAASLNATMTQNLPLDTITFDGQSIAGAVQSGTKDAFGRTYILNCTGLTITNAADTLTINGFKNGEFGLTIQGIPICFYVTSIISTPYGASQVNLSVPDINNITCSSTLQVWTAAGTLVGDVNWNNGPLFGWYWPSYEANVNGQYYMRTACYSTAEAYLNTGNNPFIYSQVFTVINGNYTLG